MDLLQVLQAQAVIDSAVECQQRTLEDLESNIDVNAGPLEFLPGRADLPSRWSAQAYPSPDFHL